MQLCILLLLLLLLNLPRFNLLLLLFSGNYIIVSAVCASLTSIEYIN